MFYNVSLFSFKFYFLKALYILISMSRHGRKIEVPTDTQPQLGDTADDIERRRREKEERDGGEREGEIGDRDNRCDKKNRGERGQRGKESYD